MKQVGVKFYYDLPSEFLGNLSIETCRLEGNSSLVADGTIFLGKIIQHGMDTIKLYLVESTEAGHDNT